MLELSMNQVDRGRHYFARYCNKATCQHRAVGILYPLEKLTKSACHLSEREKRKDVPQ